MPLSFEFYRIKIALDEYTELAAYVKASADNPSDADNGYNVCTGDLIATSTASALSARRWRPRSSHQAGLLAADSGSAAENHWLRFRR